MKLNGLASFTLGIIFYSTLVLACDLAPKPGSPQEAGPALKGAFEDLSNFETLSLIRYYFGVAGMSGVLLKIYSRDPANGKVLGWNEACGSSRNAVGNANIVCRGVVQRDGASFSGPKDFKGLSASQLEDLHQRAMNLLMQLQAARPASEKPVTSGILQLLEAAEN